MIAHLEGVLSAIRNNGVVIDVLGIGYLVHVGFETQEVLKKQEGERVRLLTHLSVRENAHDLYGFHDAEDLAFFELLIGISGIGPKTALGILNVVDVATLRRAVHSGESSYLTKVSGIGKKNAEKIVLELKDKLGPLLHEENETRTQEDIDTVEALKALGYNAKEAREALKAVPKDFVNTHERLKEALKRLAR